MARDLEPGYIQTCQICSSSDLITLLEMGHHAPCDSLLTKSDLWKEEVTYPLNLVRCGECSLVQIDYVVAPEILFPEEYPYRSGITESLVTRLQSTSRSVLARYPHLKNSVCVDIGSNDGTLLKGFKAAGLEVMGIEPSNIARIAISDGIPTIQSFFNQECVEQVHGTHQNVDIVTATNMFAHMPNMDSFMKAVGLLLSKDGVFVTESHYLGKIVETLQYDSIYHEHLRFYSGQSIKKYLEQYGFYVTAIEEIDNYGGSIRVYASKNVDLVNYDNLANFFEKEDASGINGLESMTDFADKTRTSKQQISSQLAELKARNLNVPGIGCPGRSSTLINYIGIDRETMPYIAEQNTSLKLGLFSPGKHLPIIDEKVLFEAQPEYVLLLSWHYAKEIISGLRKRGLRSKIIIPLPQVSIDEP
jgi:hypothetical protein